MSLLQGVNLIHSSSAFFVSQQLYDSTHYKPSWIFCSWVRASWINVNNCPTRCDYIQFFLYFCRQIYVFQMIPSSCSLNLIHPVPAPPRQRTLANMVRPVQDVVITVWVCSWWWMRVSSETSRAACRNIIKTVYSGILLDSYWHWHQVEFNNFYILLKHAAIMYKIYSLKMTFKGWITLELCMMLIKLWFNNILMHLSVFISCSNAVLGHPDPQSFANQLNCSEVKACNNNNNNNTNNNNNNNKLCPT